MVYMLLWAKGVISKKFENSIAQIPLTCQENIGSFYKFYVKMKKDSEETLTNFLGFPVTHINSTVHTIANRPRTYWQYLLMEHASNVMSVSTNCHLFISRRQQI